MPCENGPASEYTSTDGRELPSEPGKDRPWVTPGYVQTYNPPVGYKTAPVAETAAARRQSSYNDLP